MLNGGMHLMFIWMHISLRWSFSMLSSYSFITVRWSILTWIIWCASNNSYLYLVLIIHTWFVSTLVGNTFWLISIGYYVYINFLGYSCKQMNISVHTCSRTYIPDKFMIPALPILHKTRSLLYPLSILFLIYIISLITNWNVTNTLINFYHARVHVIWKDWMGAFI